ncbi:uncharacterized protein LOC8062693 [Sorghum bicolor]|uniref:KIB1-4 beta-propeller domain-containing protein n=1 Tax=Sorghum bicolor TaxID=4558 RepID=A0A1B6PT33_SORBI|nr:uncharacterized protein LOC8062693 [Sorghum bicolor]KXG28827.1 hypothetical protein SORBI_3005G172200 [Sorghum bicolor]|eukprot:XP_021317479.1 uncharacterized protein LOC8062693 [Sorghum bicolor]
MVDAVVADPSDPAVAAPVGSRRLFSPRRDARNPGVAEASDGHELQHRRLRQSDSRPWGYAATAVGGRYAGNVSDDMYPGPEPPRFDAGLNLLHRSWADLLPDILCAVAGRLARAEDRARMRAVCSAWLAAARLHRQPPPLPLLVLHDFNVSSFCSDGAMTGIRRIPLPLDGVGEGDVRCVGSFEGWLVGVQPYEGLYSGDGPCFLMKAFSRDVNVIHLPPPSPEPDSNSVAALSNSADAYSRYFAFAFVNGSNSFNAYIRSLTNSADAYIRYLPVINGSGEMQCVVHGPQCAMSFHKVVLSSSPDSTSKCVVAALSTMHEPMLALWTPGMSSWCVCFDGCITMYSDIAFYQGKLYMFNKLASQFQLFSIEISEDGDRGLMVSCVESCVTEELPQIDGTRIRWWKIAEWNGKLLLILTYLLGPECWQNIREVSVLEVDLSANPVSFTKINSLNGDCIFVSPCSSGTFHVCQYDGVEDDLVYFIDGVEDDFAYFNDGEFLSDENAAPAFVKFVYNMRDGTVAPFAAGILEYLQVPKGRPMNPTWLFPSE